VHYHAQKAGKEAGGPSSKTGGVGCSVRGCLKFSLLNRGPHFSPEVTVTLALAAYVSFVSHTHKSSLPSRPCPCLIHCAAPHPLIVTSYMYCHYSDSVKTCTENVN